MPRFIDADPPCPSREDLPTRAELAAEREGEKYDEGYSDGHRDGYDDGEREGRAQMHAEVMEAIRGLLAQHEGAVADAISLVHDALMALADDAGGGA
jgi:flagellar biosynthesis/type III secretory pathway protein FliH